MNQINYSILPSITPRRRTFNVCRGRIRDYDSIIDSSYHAERRLSDSPHVVALVGGGEWGPRLVAKALLGSMYANWVKDTVVLDMEEAVRIYHESGFDEVR